MDTVHRFLFEKLDIRGVVVQLGPAWHKMQANRGYAQPVLQLLGQLAAVSTIIGSTMKTPGRLTFHLQGDGPVQLLVVDCDRQLRLRGMAKAEVSLAPRAIGELFADGHLAMTLDTGEGAPYQSIVPIVGESVSAIFEHYLIQSEQAPARLWLDADTDNACGLFLQKLPGADNRDTDGWNRIVQLANTLNPKELLLPAATLLPRLFAEEDIRLFEPQPVAYHCPRDEAKVMSVLHALGREEIEAALAENGELVVRDEICNEEYRFGRELLNQMISTLSRTLH